MKQAVVSNRDKVFLEILETRELYELMLRWSAGHSLTLAEKKVVKAQLLDICRTIPALAIFLAPFGSVILVVLIKFLPFDIMPSSFQEVIDDNPPA